jgi:hypothetical protein
MEVSSQMVKVYPDRHGSKSNDYSDAFYAAVSEGGHLLVVADKSTPSEIVAIYAPSAWDRVEVDAKPQAA